MTKDVGILILGLLIAAMPFLGFPVNIEKIIFIVSGLGVAVLAFLIRGDIASATPSGNGDVFFENGGHQSGEHTEGQSVRGERTGHGEHNQKH